MFRLVPYFLITSLLACTLAAIGLSTFYRHRCLMNLVQLEEDKNIAIAQVFVNSLWREFYPFLTSTSTLSDRDLRNHPTTTNLSHAVLSQMKGLAVVKVKIFDPEGRIVFSTDAQQIGDSKNHDQGFLEARSGKAITQVSQQTVLSGFEKITVHQSLMSSYLPIRFGESTASKIEGVIQLYSDVTPAWQGIEKMQRTIIFGVVLIFVALYFVLFLIVRHADRILQRQELARQQVDEVLNRKAEELVRFNAELEQFVLIASHDLQEPLRKIESFGDRLKSNCVSDLSVQGQDYLERMQKATQRMRTLIQDLLTFSRVTTNSQSFLPVNLSEIVYEVIVDLEAQVQQTGGRIEVGMLPTINAEPVQMYQLFQNLISNALKFHRPNEPPVVKVDSILLQPWQKNSGQWGCELHQLGACCQITVTDNGIGFDEKYRERIFLAFQRLHSRSQYEGTGIGLAVCAKIVERHGGNITARSVLGQGSTFIVTLPININHKVKSIYETDKHPNHDSDCG
jgi:signal transduction histidine kinase